MRQELPKGHKEEQWNNTYNQQLLPSDNPGEDHQINKQLSQNQQTRLQLT